MGTVVIVLVSAVVGFVTGVFVYRNNVKDFSKIADKVDDLYDRVEEKLADLEDKLSK